MTAPAGLLGRLFPAPPGLNDEQLGQARQQGLLAAGLSLLESSGPSLMPTSLGQALARGVGAGQRAYGGMAQMAAEREAAMAAQQQAAERQAAEQAQYQEIFGALGLTGQESPTELYNKMSLGLQAAMRTGNAKAATTISEVMKSMAGAVTPRQERSPIKLDSGTETLFVDPNDPNNVIARYPQPASTRDRGAAEDMETQRRFQRENALVDDYTKVVEPILGAYADIDQSLDMVPQAKAGDGMAQVALLYSFVKAMDPTSVVREGEVALARQAASLYQQAQGLLAKYGQGQAVVVPPALVDQMALLLKQRLAGYERRVTSRQRDFQTRARRWNIDPSVFRGLEPKYSAPAPTGPAPGPAPTGPASGPASSKFFSGGR